MNKVGALVEVSDLRRVVLGLQFDTVGFESQFSCGRKLGYRFPFMISLMECNGEVGSEFCGIELVRR